MQRRDIVTKRARLVTVLMMRRRDQSYTKKIVYFWLWKNELKREREREGVMMEKGKKWEEREWGG